jgi:hypothetical protein
MYRRFRDYYDSSDGVTRIIALVALALIFAAAFPTLANNVPYIANGITCTALSNARGDGTFQSVNKPTEFALRMEISSPDGYATGQPWVITVRFINDSPAPMILALAPAEAVFRWTQRESGLSFFVQSVQNGLVLGEPANVRASPPNRQQYPPDTLLWLMPNQRCSQTFTVEAGRLQAAGIRSGQYRLAAVYRNTQKGVLSPVGALTPTPVFRDQGVYTTIDTGVKSNLLLINVQ